MHAYRIVRGLYGVLKTGRSLLVQFLGDPLRGNHAIVEESREFAVRLARTDRDRVAPLALNLVVFDAVRVDGLHAVNEFLASRYGPVVPHAALERPLGAGLRWPVQGVRFVFESHAAHQ